MKKIFTFLFALNVFMVDGQQSSQFESYIANFKTIEKELVVNEYFTTPMKQIPEEYVRSFVEEKQDCKCAEGEFWYQFGHKVEKGNFIFAIIRKICDIPSSKGEYPYNENILTVYSKEGKILDSRIISRSGDLWLCDYSGTWTPFMLQIEQANIAVRDLETKKSYPLPCEIETYSYSITKEGKIDQKLISKGLGNVVWNEMNQNSSIVADIPNNNPN